MYHTCSRRWALTPREKLEASITATFDLIHQYTTILGDASDPKEQSRARRARDEQTALLREQLTRYAALCQVMGYAALHDITEIATLQGIDLSAPVPPAVRQAMLEESDTTLLATLPTDALPPHATLPPGSRMGYSYGTMNQYNYYGTPPPTDPPEPPPDPPLPNPFGKRGRIENPAEFFGRAELLRRIFEELERGSNLALIGEREMGKSSLLAMIAAHGPARLGLPPDAFLAIDMQLIHSEDDFFAALCDELKIAPACRGYRLMRKLHNRRFILCLDEIEKMRREKFSVDARDELRGLANGATTPLTLVIASSQPLDELFPDAEGMTSPLNGICHPLDVQPFSRDEARAFLAASLQGTGVRFSEDEIADLLEQSQRRPSRLQQAAAELYRRYTQQGA